MKIAVLLGGTSAERDVSLSSGVAVARTLAENGHEVQAIDPAYGDRLVDFAGTENAALVKTDPSDIEKQRAELDRNVFITVDYLLKQRFDTVFLALHGGYGEDGKIQALLDLAGIPYSGSGSRASAIAMDKHLSKILLRAAGVPTADWLYITDPADLDKAAAAALGLPLVVKPNAQGSTVGLTIVKETSQIVAAVATAFKYDEAVLLEKYIPGRELTVTVLGEEALPVIEIIPKSGFYDYESKYQAGRTQYICPAEISPEQTVAVQESARLAHAALGCRGYSRVDYRMDETGSCYCLEANTLPGMTATSLVPKAARAAGINFYELIMRILDLAKRGL